MLRAWLLQKQIVLSSNLPLILLPPFRLHTQLDIRVCQPNYTVRLILIAARLLIFIAVIAGEM